jgi:hypothetical protein
MSTLCVMFIEKVRCFGRPTATRQLGFSLLHALIAKILDPALTLWTSPN